MRLTQTLKQKPTVSPQLVLANQLLQFTALELEQAIAQELSENPALELTEVGLCPICGGRLSDSECPTCGRVEAPVDEAWRASDDGLREDEYPTGGTPGGSGWDDPISRLPSSTTLAEHVLRQARLSLSPEDVPIARQLTGCLDERGFLSRGVDDVASDLDIEPGRVGRVLDVIQSLEPAGIGARDARECLLVQLEELYSQTGRRSMAKRLIADHWDKLGRSSLSNIGEEVNASVDEVREALHFVRENLNPFPAYAWWAQRGCAPSESGTACPEPDVIIRESPASGKEYEIELPRAGTYGLRVSSAHCQALDRQGDDRDGSDEQGWEKWRELCGRARLFVRSIEQRWETLHDLMRCLIDYQRDFLHHGERYLRPLTRAEVAEMMDVHESTVSRAVAGKYVKLPCGKVVALETFFDSAAPIKHLIEELIDQEETSLSDRAIAERLKGQGYDISRRTVAKYRNAMNILPSSLRRRSKEL